MPEDFLTAQEIICYPGFSFLKVSLFLEHRMISILFLFLLHTVYRYSLREEKKESSL